MKRTVRSYESDRIVVDYDLRRCIHAAECVRGLPDVFDPRRRPWIDPTATDDAHEIARVIERCPTGALRYHWKSDEPAERAAPENVIRIEPDGPLYISGELHIRVREEEVVEETRVALCRCGQSKNKPFCDNSHRESAFAAHGEVKENSLKAEDDATPSLTLHPLPNGPVLISGSATIEAADGSRTQGTGGALCRCGHSGNKPFCDGSHRTRGFTTE